MFIKMGTLFHEELKNAFSNCYLIYIQMELNLGRMRFKILNEIVFYHSNSTFQRLEPNTFSHEPRTLMSYFKCDNLKH